MKKASDILIAICLLISLGINACFVIKQVSNSGKAASAQTDEDIANLAGYWTTGNNHVYEDICFLPDGTVYLVLYTSDQAADYSLVEKIRSVICGRYENGHIIGVERASLSGSSKTPFYQEYNEVPKECYEPYSAIYLVESLSRDTIKVTNRSGDVFSYVQVSK